MVFSIGDGRGGVPTYDNSKGDDLLGAYTVETGVTIYTGGSANVNLEFNADGSLNESSNGIFSICDSRGVNHGKTITVIGTGRPATADASDCTP